MHIYFNMRTTSTLSKEINIHVYSIKYACLRKILICLIAKDPNIKQKCKNA